jgi:hypothetical protein
VGWLDAQGGPKTGLMRDDFPRFGRVFVPSNVTSQIALDDCAVLDVEKDEYPHERHNWHATNFVARTYEVMSAPPTVSNCFELFLWCKNPHSKKNGRHSELLIQLHDGSYVGPFSPPQAESPIKPKNAVVSQWRNQDVCKVLLPNIDRSIAYPVSPPERELTFDPTDAIKRLLKLSKENHSLAWLSRDKITELSFLLVSLNEGGPNLWVKSIILNGLEQSASLADSAQSICESLLSHPSLAPCVAEWKATIAAEQRGLAESQLKRRETAVVEREKKLVDIDFTTNERMKKADLLASEIQMLDAELVTKQSQAQEAFGKEVARLANEPTQLLLLRRLLGTDSSASQTANFPSLRITAATDAPIRPNANSLVEALSNNLKNCGVVGSASVALAVAAAIEAGQPVYFHGPFARLLCDAAADGLARPSYLIAETAAGILTPTLWPDSEKDTAVVIHNLNMASTELVFGSMMKSVLEQIASGRRGLLDVLATTCAEPHFLTLESLPFGPVIDSSRLSFCRVTLQKPNLREPDLAKAPLQIREALAPIDREEIEKWHKSFSDLWRGPFELALRNAGRSIEILLGEDSASTAVEYLIAWWLSPRVSTFKHEELEPNLKRRLEHLGIGS